MQECAVFGVPAENGLGQRPVAVVRLRPGTAEPSADELREQGREELAAAGPTPSAAVLVAHDAVDSHRHPRSVRNSEGSPPTCRRPPCPPSRPPHTSASSPWNRTGAAFPAGTTPPTPNGAKPSGGARTASRRPGSPGRGRPPLQGLVADLQAPGRGARARERLGGRAYPQAA
ncbi:hypothetical protein ACFFTU_26495 [Streptomyces cremeus]|uniref:AMP-binding enzyme C-terminal domain-containing protein n=1 Tax=Streptomyces cremeus TaxID=66881 RepID=A0ABV5PK98_STRCM